MCNIKYFLIWVQFIKVEKLSKIIRLFVFKKRKIIR